jgi:hypothetical protein
MLQRVPSDLLKGSEDVLRLQPDEGVGSENALRCLSREILATLRFLYRDLRVRRHLRLRFDGELASNHRQRDRGEDRLVFALDLDGVFRAQEDTRAPLLLSRRAPLPLPG